MKVFVAVMLFLLSLTSFSGSPDPSTIQWLQKQRSDYVAGFLNENEQQITKHYDADVRLMPEANPAILGETNAAQYFRAFFSRFDIQHYHREETEILDLGSRISEIGMFELRMKNASGEKRQLKGKYLNLWRKTQEGTLTLVTDIWNFDHAVDFTSELHFNDVPSLTMALEPHIAINGPAVFELAAYGALIDETVPLRDANVLGQFHSDDAKWLPNYRPMLEGRNDIDTHWERHVNDLPGFEKLQTRTNYVDDIDSYVIQHSSHIANWRSGEYSGVSTGKHVRIWKRQEDGRLKSFRLISAYDK